MTHQGHDPDAMWFKQVPVGSSRDAPGVWAQHLIDGHTTVDWSREDPRTFEADAYVVGAEDGV